MIMRVKWQSSLSVARAVGIVAVFFTVGCKGEKAVQYETAAIQRGPLVAKITATGTLSALITVQVGSQVSGRIQEIHVDYNSQVKKGQLIARIDPRMFQAAVEQARANHAAAKANLARATVEATQAERSHQRQQALAEENLIAAADLDAAKSAADSATAAVEGARSSVAQTEAALHQTEINLAYTAIVSPINGVVISRSVDVGQTVAASLQTPTLFTIAEDLTRMQVDTNVAEADIGKLQPGVEATFTVDAYPQMPFVGHVRQIRNAPITVQNVVTYDAVIDVDNPEQKLRPGMTANVAFVYARVDDALRVPNAALRYRPAAAPPAKKETGNGAVGGKKPFTTEREVWVLKNGVTASVRFTPGITDGSYTQVVSGALNEGDLLITGSSVDGGQKGGPRPPPGRMF